MAEPLAHDTLVQESWMCAKFSSVGISFFKRNNQQHNLLVIINDSFWREYGFSF